MVRNHACFALLLLIVLSSCGKAKTISSNYQVSVTYFTHGSPLALIAGATTATSGLLPTADVLEYEDFHLMGIHAFQEKSRQSTVSSFAEVEDENSTDNAATSGRAPPIYRFTEASSGRMLWSAANDPLSPVFGFDSTGTELKLLDINGQAVELVHYSLKSDKKAFSLLVTHSQKNSGLVLTSYVFGSTDTVTSPTYTSGDYQYLIGSEKVTWEALPEVRLCGSNTAAVTETIQKSVKAWGADPLAGNEPLPISFSVPAVYPPFSDLNSHCIYVVPSFDESDGPTAKTLGVNLPSINLATRKIVDSDVFLFADFIKEELEAGEVSPVTMHEMGHFWGLGHDFRVLSDGSALHQTIMGYSKGTDFITPWDFEAIRDLYTAGFVVTP